MKSTRCRQLKIVVLASLVTLGSCKGSCESTVAEYRTQKCALIVEKVQPERPVMLKGRNLYTNKSDRFRDNAGWWNSFVYQIDIGDTVIKLENELVFSIHKKDTLLSFPLQCEGKTYH